MMEERKTDTGKTADGAVREKVIRPGDGPADSYVAIDLETTGIGAKREKITEIGMVKVENGAVTETYHTMVNPGRPIPAHITELTGIDDHMVKDAPMIQEVIGEVIAFCGELPVLGHQIMFDYGFLVQAAVNGKLRFERKGIDTLKLCRKFMPPEEKKNLAAACAYFHAAQDTAHRALSDAMAAHELYQAMKRQYLPGNEDAFTPKVLQYKAKKERQATQRQKQHLHDLLKYHKIDLTVSMDSMSGNEISRMTDRIIFTHGRIPENERGRDKKPE